MQAYRLTPKVLFGSFALRRTGRKTAFELYLHRICLIFSSYLKIREHKHYYDTEKTAVKQTSGNIVIAIAKSSK